MALTPYNLVGNRPDISDKQVVVFPEKTPLLSFIAEEVAADDTVSYVFDTPDNPTPTALLSGKDTTTYKDQYANRVSFSTYAQEFESTFGVENRQASNDPAALAKQIAAAEMRAMEDQQRQIEVTIGSDQAHASQSGSTPFQLGGLGWFQSTSNSSIDSRYRANAADATAMGSVNADTIKAVLQTLCENNGGLQDFVLFANSALYGAITKAYLNSSVLGRVQFMHQGNKNIDLTVMSISTEFGTFDIVYAPWLGASSSILGTEFSLGTTQKCRGYLVRRGVLSLAYKSGHKNKVSYHENKGAGERCSVRSIVALKNYAPRAIGMFNATSL